MVKKFESGLIFGSLILVLCCSFMVSAGIPTFTANRTALNTIVLTFNEVVNGTAIDDSFTVVGATSVTNTAPEGELTVTLTTVGLIATDGTPNVGYNATAGDIISNSTSAEIANGGTIAAADSVAPTFTAKRTALNTIVLTFSETVSGSAISGSFIVVGQTAATTNTAPSVGTAVTLTTTGLTATDGTPAVGYNATAGDIVDDSAATNEVANGGAISATDEVKPIFVSAAATSDTNIRITFSENVTVTTAAVAILIPVKAISQLRLR